MEPPVQADNEPGFDCLDAECADCGLIDAKDEMECLTREVNVGGKFTAITRTWLCLPCADKRDQWDL